MVFGLLNGITDEKTILKEVLFFKQPSRLVILQFS
jgi:hypothetical protein